MHLHRLDRRRAGRHKADMAELASVPRLFDRALVRARLRRAHMAGFEPFLLERMTGDALDRLSAVTRHFSDVLDLGTPSRELARALVSSGSHGRVYRAAAFAQDGVDVVCAEDLLPLGDWCVRCRHFTARPASCE